MQNPEEKAMQMTRDAEAAKAKIFPRPGKDHEQFWFRVNNEKNEFRFIAEMDEDYLVVGNHVDQVTQDKIMNGEYVDFSKLIPKDKILCEEDGRLELIVRNGRTFWSPVTESVTISNFARWEQAFRVFSNIYTRRFPQKAGELIQYNHIIHSISLTYIWENVYSYDKEFRIHLSKHPQQSWAVILQQTWSMRLRDRLTGSAFNNFASSGGAVTGSDTRNKSNEPCKQYNRGRCSFGPNCKYEHKCSYCGKFGHGIVTCRRLQRDKEKKNSTRKDRDANTNDHQPSGSGNRGRHGGTHHDK